MERVLRVGMGMGVVLGTSLGPGIRCGAVSSSEDILGTIMESAFANPPESSEPGQGDPYEEDDMDPQERQAFLGRDQRGY